MIVMGRRIWRGFLTLLSATPQNDMGNSVETGAPSPPLSAPAICQYHDPPPGVNYGENQSVFGAILRGEKPAVVLKETKDLFAFVDRTPRAPLHALVIPKKSVKSVFQLTQDDLPMLEEMHELGLDLMKSHFPAALKKNDFILCFHVPPFNSVDHIHLHVLAPASQMNWIFRYGKYQAGNRWCTSHESVRTRLVEGTSATPYLYPWKLNIN